jgi:deoxyribonuclease-2
LKLPALRDNPTPFIAQGYGYAYLDARNLLLKVAEGSIRDSRSLIGTLNQIYNRTLSGYIMWNDETPSGHNDESRAHSKGVLGFNENAGFYLRHSVPRYPNYVRNGYQYPPDEREYGQSFLCVSYGTGDLNTLAKQFLINDPQVYDSYVPSAIGNRFPSLRALANKNNNNYYYSISDVTSNIVAVRSQGGATFVDFAKSKSWGKDLFEDLVAPYVKADFFVESWGRPLMPSSCRPKYPWNVMNVRDLSFGTGLSFDETKDHSKWAVTTNRNMVCVGDINRMTSQRARGGGTTCFQNSSVGSSIYALITGADSCNSSFIAKKT